VTRTSQHSVGAQADGQLGLVDRVGAHLRRCRPAASGRGASPLDAPPQRGGAGQLGQGVVADRLQGDIGASPPPYVAFGHGGPGTSSGLVEDSALAVSPTMGPRLRELHTTRLNYADSALERRRRLTNPACRGNQQAEGPGKPSGWQGRRQRQGRHGQGRKGQGEGCRRGPWLAAPPLRSHGVNPMGAVATSHGAEGVVERSRSAAHVQKDPPAGRAPGEGGAAPSPSSMMRQ
jgi:hypothetical protein